MGHQFNPHNLLSMSLEVDRINQIQHLHPSEKQALFEKQEKQRKRIEQRRVESREDVEGSRVGKEDQEEESSAQESSQNISKNKGNNIDIMI